MIRDLPLHPPLYYTFTYLFLPVPSAVWYSALLFIFFLLTATLVFSSTQVVGMKSREHVAKIVEKL